MNDTTFYRHRHMLDEAEREFAKVFSDVLGEESRIYDEYVTVEQLRELAKAAEELAHRKEFLDWELSK